MHLSGNYFRNETAPPEKHEYQAKNKCDFLSNNMIKTLVKGRRQLLLEEESNSRRREKNNRSNILVTGKNSLGQQ